MLIVIYLFNVIVVGYIIFALERAYGTCMDYRDVIWMMGQGFKQFIHLRYLKNKIVAIRIFSDFC